MHVRRVDESEELRLAKFELSQLQETFNVKTEQCRNLQQQLDSLRRKQ